MLPEFLTSAGGGDVSAMRMYAAIFKIIYQTSFIWLPPLLASIAWNLWVDYKQAKFFLSQKPTLLEMRLPMDIVKSPHSMELFFISLYQAGGEGTWIDRYIEGKTRPWFSLEIVSLEGQVKFFIWTRSMWKNHVESQIYAQFPGVEVVEVPDYTRDIKYEKDKMVLWGCEYELNKPDPYPIKTYQDASSFKVDLFPGGSQTAHQVDPISPVIEYMGSLGPGEQAWIQIIIRAHKKDRKATGTWFGKADWKQDLKKEVEKIRKKEKDGGKLSKSDVEAIEAMERSVAKFPFETGIRSIYIANKESFQAVHVPGLSGSFRQYNSQNLNGFKPARGMTDFDYPWQDYKNIRKESTRRGLLDAFKRRSYFYPPHKSKHFILNTEELATTYHFPSAAITTPTLQRVTAKKADPPRDLPI